MNYIFKAVLCVSRLLGRYDGELGGSAVSIPLIAAGFSLTKSCV